MRQPVASKKLNQLKSLYNDGNFSAAASYAETLLKNHKTSYILWYLYGAACTKTGQLERAEKALLNAGRLGPKVPDIPYLLANVRKMRGNTEGALQSFKRAARLTPQSAEPHIQIGTLYGQMGKFEEAVLSYDRALKILPDQAAIYNNRGVFLKELGDFEQAAESYQTAVRLKPDYADAHYNLGNLLADEARLDEAAESYERALQISPSLVKARNALGAILNEQGKTSDALVCYKQVLEAAPLYVKTIKNLARFPTQVLPSETIDALEEKTASLSDAAISAADKSFIEADIQRLRANIPEAFRLFCKANQIKSSELADRSSLDTEKRRRVLSEFQNWSPHPQAKQPSDGVKTLFILGPSRSGKSTLERLLGLTPTVHCGLEKCRIYGRHEAAWQRKIDALRSGGGNHLSVEDVFFLGKDKNSEPPVELVTCTHPGIIHRIPELHEYLPDTHFCMVQRNTIDLAAEILVSNYIADNPYAYDAASILEYIKWYNAMWDTISTKIGGMTISFEDMMADPVLAITNVGTALDHEFESAGGPSLTKEPKSVFRDNFQTAFEHELQTFGVSQ